MKKQLNTVFAEWMAGLRRDDTVIVPEMADAKLVKAAFAETLGGQGAAFLPRITTLHQLAIDLSGYQPGSIIRRQDFEVLLSRSADERIPAVFREKSNRGYRENLFAVLQLLSRSEEGLRAATDEQLAPAGIDRSACVAIEEMLSGSTLRFRFRGDLYRDALRALVSRSEAPGDARRYLLPGRQLSPSELKFADALGVTEIRFSGHTPESFRLISENVLANAAAVENRLDALQKVSFLRGRSETDSFRAVRREMLALLDGGGYRLSDFSIVVSGDGAAERLSAWLPAHGIPCFSSSKAAVVAGLPMALHAVRTAWKDDAALLVSFYNAHIAAGNPALMVEWNVPGNEPRVNLRELAKAIDAAAKGERHYRLDFQGVSGEALSRLSVFLKALRRWALPGEAELERGIREILKTLTADSVELFRLSAYEGTAVNLFSRLGLLEALFGKTAKNREIVEYLLEVAQAANRKPFADEAAGVRIRSLEEFVPPSRVLWFIGLQQDEFLKDGYRNRLLGNPGWKALEAGVMSADRDAHLRKRFCETLETAEKAVFVIPDFGEDTVVSDHFSRILRLLRFRRDTVRVTGAPEALSFEADFPVTAADVLKSLPDADDTVEIPVRETGLTVRAADAINVAASLHSATSVERFCTCPARYVHELNSDTLRVESREKYRKGNLVHTVAEMLLERVRTHDCYLDDEIYPSAAEPYLYRSAVSSTKTRESASRILSEAGIPVSPPTEGVSPDVEALFAFPALRELIQAEWQKAAGEGKDERRKALLQLRDAVEAGIKTLLWLGPLDEASAKTVYTEVCLTDAELPGGNPVLRESYIDLMLLDRTGVLRMVDFKTSSDAYPEEMKAYHRVQLLLYREAVLQALMTGKRSVFSGEGRRNPERKASLLPAPLLDRLIEVAKNQGANGFTVSADYFAFDRSAPLSAQGEFDAFLALYTSRFPEKGAYPPEANPGCEYCPLSASCERSGDNRTDLSDWAEQCQKPSPAEMVGHYPLVAAEKQAGVQPGRTWIRFTGDRAKALQETSRDLVLSAGAGSGKTEVLSARVIHLLLTGEAKLEEIVCITFTNRAVGEMKNRILRKLNEALDTGRYAAIERPFMQLSDIELERLRVARDQFHENSRIMTFHSFCKRILEENGQNANGPALMDLGWKMASPHEIRDELVLWLKKRHDENYREFLTGDAVTSEEREIFLEWVENQRFYYYSDKSSGGLLEDLLSVVTEAEHSGFSIEEIMAMEEKADGEWRSAYQSAVAEYRENRRKALALLRQVEEESGKTYPGLIADIGNDDWKCALTAMRAKTESAAAFQEHVKRRIRTSMVYDHAAHGPIRLESLEMEMRRGAAVRKSVLVIAAGLRDWLDRYKRDHGMLEQEDLHRLALRMLNDRPDVQQRLTGGIRHLMIDEFQDTNWLQDRLVRTIQSSGDIRLFIVGDRKQSIYRFQQCDDRIFSQRARECGSEGYLRLPENYRSSPALITLYNRYFSSKNSMLEYRTLGTTPETEEPALIPEGRSGALKTNIRIVRIGYDQCEDEGEKPYGELSDSELDALVKVKEAHYLAGMIRKNHEEGAPFSSWGILVRQYSRTGYLLKLLRDYGIPYSFQMSGKLLSLSGVVEFLGVLRAFMGLEPPGSYARIPGIEAEILALTAAERPPLLALAETILAGGAYQEWLRTKPDYAERMESLEQLLGLIASVIRETGEESARFFARMDKLAEDDSADVRTWARDTVRILTVHSAKGLEFDNVILANVSSREASDHQLLDFLHSVDADGHLIDVFPRGRRDMYGNAVKNGDFWWNSVIRNRNRELSNHEQANLLYVAVTRARKNLFISVLANNFNEAKTDAKYKSRLEKQALPVRDWIWNLDENAEEVFGFLRAEYPQANVSSEKLDFRRIPEINPEGFVSAIRIQSSSGRTIKTGFTLRPVTSVLKESPSGFDEEPSAFSPNAGDETRDYLSTELGTIAHRFMELNVRAFAISTQAGVGSQTIVADYIKSLDGASETMKKLLNRMLKHAVECPEYLSIIRGADEIMTEQPFLLTGSGGGVPEKTVLDGVIDLIVLRGGEAFVLDYKTAGHDGPLDPAIRLKYERQLRIYMDAVGSAYPGKTVKGALLIMTENRSRVEEIQV